MARRDDRSLSIILVPDGGDESRTYRVSYRRLRQLAVLGGVLALALALFLGSWWYLAVRAAEARELESRLASYEADRQRMVALVTRLEELEAQYERIRSLFGSGAPGVASDLWLPPPASGRTRGTSGAGTTRPTSWPLTERGFVTQTLLEDASEHPGVDIAVPAGSYVRAAGDGEVSEAGEDPVYGLFVVIDHGEGYRSRYAHASQLFVETGGRVRRNEVIALSGSTGRSTAPHLHFEILLDGEPVDPLELVDQPD